MKVNCPKCERSYNVDDHRIPATGLKMRCPKCQSVFTVKKKRKETKAYGAPDLSATMPAPQDEAIGGSSSDELDFSADTALPEAAAPPADSAPKGQGTDAAEGDAFEIPDQQPKISFDGLTIPGDAPYSDKEEEEPEEFEIPDHKPRISFDGLNLPPLPEQPKPKAPTLPKPTKSFAKAPPPKKEEESDDFPIPEMPELEDPGELTLSDAPPPVESGVPIAPPPTKGRTAPPVDESEELSMPAEPALPEMSFLPEKAGGVELPELSRSINVGAYGGAEGVESELPPKLELPEDPATNAPSDPAVGATQAQIDFSPSVSGFSPSQESGEEEFDLAAPISDPPAPSAPAPGTNAEIDFGNINLPSIDDEDSSDALPMALSSDIDPSSAPASSPSPASLDAPILDAPPPLESPAMEETLPPEDVLEPLDAPVSSLPPLGVSLESKEPPSATAIGMGVGSHLPNDLPSPSDFPDESPSANPRTGTQRIVSSGGVTFGEVSLDAMSEGTQDNEGDFGELSFGTGGLPSEEPDTGGFGSSDFGDMSLGDSPGDSGGGAGFNMESAGEDGEFADFPVKDTADGPDLGDIGLDLEEDPMAARQAGALMEQPESAMGEGEEVGHHEPAKAFDGRRKWERQGRRTKLLFLGILLLVLAAGAGMTYTPLGPFGAKYLYKLIPKATNEKAVQQAEQTASWHVKKDTFFAVSEAIRLTDMVSGENPGSEDLKILLVYLCYLYQVRFELDKNMDAEANRYLGSIILSESDSPYAPAAQMAQFIRFSRPLQLDAQKKQALAKSSDGQAMLAEGYLHEGQVQQALVTAKSLDAKEKSARSGFLVARALAALGTDASRKQLIAKLTPLIAANKEHLDAILLMANTLSQERPVDFDKARALATAVIEAPKNNLITSQKAEAHALLARLHLIKRDYDDAAKEVALAEKLNPENVSMLLSKGRLALQDKDFSQAGTAFNKALANDPRNLVAMLGKIETDIFGGELSDGKKALAPLLPKHPNNAMAHYLMGEIHLDLKEDDKAEAELKKAIELDKELLEAYVSLSKLYLQQNKNDDAMKVLDKASETVPGSPLIKKTLALGHVAREDFPSAIVELDNALKLNPDDIEAHFLMAQMYRRMESFEDAKRALDEVERRNPGYPGLALERGLLMEAAGDVKKALSAYKKALSQKPNDTHLKLRVAAASHILGDLEGAEALLKDVIASQPESPEANFYVGETYRQLGQVTEAIGFLKKATTLDPSKPIYFLRYGMALIEMNDLERALDALETAQKLDNKIAETYIRLGQIRLLQGAPRLAIETIRQGLALDNSSGDGLYFMGQAYDQVADRKQAMEYYRKATALMPKNGELFFRLALSELTIRGNKTALPSFATAVRLGDKKDGKPPQWLFEALYRLGTAQRATGQRSQAIATFKRYLEVAPDNAIDRAQVIANLDELGVYIEEEQ